MNNRRSTVLAVLSLLILCSCGARWQETAKDGYNIITQKKGATLGYSPTSGISILECDGYAFKDLNKNGELDVYEDWRKPMRERAVDLASKVLPQHLQVCVMGTPTVRSPDFSFW